MFAASKTASVSGGYQISRSLRFNSADSAYLNRTPASAGNRTTWTWSGWVKRSALTGSRQGLFVCASSAGTVYTGLEFNASNQLASFDSNAPSSTSVVTTQVFRDVSAWYHIVYVIDTTQATASNRVKIYLNGSQITSFSTADYPPQNSTTYINSNNSHSLGSWLPTATSFYLDGYMTEVNFIDGQALTPSSFGYTNPQTGVWSPLKFVGTYGTNGFYLNFSDNSNTTAATLGKDYSGNGNNWTPNNFSVTAGAGNDSLVDSPTSYGTDTGVGGTVRGNYATLNPLDKGADITVVNGNLDVVASTGWRGVRATLGMSSSKWYCEYTPTSGTYHIVSISTQLSSGRYIDDAYGWGYQWDGTKVTNGSSSSYGASWGVGDIIGIAFDADAGTLTFYKNGTSQGTAFSSLTNGPYLVGIGTYPSATGTYNFGQRPFAYTAPSGFKALCTQNLPTPTIGATTATQAGKFFNPVLYTGNGTSTQTITGVGFQPDWVWTKSISNVSNNSLVDSVRGGTKLLISELTDSEYTGTWINSFNSDGYVLGSNSTNSNASGYTYVAWNWRASNATAVTNTAGSITSTVSANTTSGFSVVTYTGSGTSLSTVGHGLGAVPSMVIVKARSASGLSWYVYQKDVGNTKFLELNSSAAPTTFNLWESTNPTSSVFTISNNAAINGSGTTFVAYCFAPVSGYSAFGQYTGNGSADGPFVFTGFRPAYVMIKSSSNASNWLLLDNKRNTYNVEDKYLSAESSAAEGTFTLLDFTSNGFKIRSSDTSINGGDPRYYIYMAFAENPFKYSLAR